MVAKKENDVILKEVEDLDVKLQSLDPHTQGAEYEQLLHIRSLLKDALYKESNQECNEAEQNLRIEEKKRELEKRSEDDKKGVLSKIDPNVAVKAGVTVLVAVSVMVFESFGHIFTSKATSFMPKLL